MLRTPSKSNSRVMAAAPGKSSAQGISQASFTLFAPQISVTAPVAGATWVLGEQQTIRWSSNLPATASVAVELSHDGGSTWTELAVAIFNSSSFSWNVAGATSNNVLARISLNDTYILRGVSQAAFTIQ